MEVLVVCPDDYDRAMFANMDGFEFHFLPPAPSHWHPDPAFDSIACLDHALDYARRHPCDGVLSTHDLGDLIAAIVAREVGLPGPAPESVFLALHKFYGRRREAAPIRCAAFPLHGPVPEIVYPAFLKPPWLKLGLLSYKLRNRSDLEAALANARREYPAWARQYYPLFERAVEVKHYPLAVEDIVLVEEFVEGRQATVEGWVHNGQTGIWAIADTNPYAGSQAIDNFSLPSRLPEDVQEAMKKHAEEAVRRIGFDNGFFNVEMWETANGIVTTEINGRAAVCFNGLYELALGRSIFPDVARLACGIKPQPFGPPAPSRVSGQFNLTTFSEGEAGALLDYRAAENVAGLSFLRSSSEHVRAISQFGVVLAQLEIAGGSYEEISAQADRARQRLLRTTHSGKSLARIVATGAVSPSRHAVSTSDLGAIAQRAAALLSGGTWNRQAIDDITRELENLAPDAATLQQLRSIASDETWHEFEVFDQPGVHASLFYLPEGATIPMHDHPAMTVISKVLLGKMRTRTLTWIDALAGLARDDGDSEINAEDRAVTYLGSPGAGVLHEITALSECMFFDLFAPYYSEEEGRDCSYYQVGLAHPGLVRLAKRDSSVMA